MSSKLHLIYISSNNYRHPITKTFTPLHYTCRHYFLTFMGPCIVNVFLSTTNKMQRCIILFITVNALHVSSCFSAHHKELKSVHAASGICQTCNLHVLLYQTAAFVLYSFLLVFVYWCVSFACLALMNLTFMGPRIVNVFLSMTNKIQCCIILFIIVNKLDKYLMLHVQIWAPDDERENRSKHVERWQ
jgi:hypothetical protein